MKKYPHGLTLIAVCAAIEDYQRNEDSVPEEGILAAFNTLLAHSDIADAFRALEKQRDALAAENATIKTMNDVLSEELRGYESDGADDGPIAHKLWHSNSETPATDAYLNSVRAEGADKVAEYHFVRIDALKDVSRQGHLFHKAAHSDAVNVANLFRAGKDGE